MSENALINGPITRDLISAELLLLADKTNLGGHSIFLGQVRGDIREGKKVIAIEYSAYDSMIQKEAEKIIKSVLSEFNDVKYIRILHSAGRINAGEISLFVLVSGGHRRQVIDACSKTVELIKTNFPVWKKEIFEDNTHGWQENPVA